MKFTSGINSILFCLLWVGTAKASDYYVAVATTKPIGQVMRAGERFSFSTGWSAASSLAAGRDAVSVCENAFGDKCMPWNKAPKGQCVALAVASWIYDDAPNTTRSMLLAVSDFSEQAVKERAIAACSSQIYTGKPEGTVLAAKCTPQTYLCASHITSDMVAERLESVAREPNAVRRPGTFENDSSGPSASSPNTAGRFDASRRDGSGAAAREQAGATSSSSRQGSNSRPANGRSQYPAANRSQSGVLGSAPGSAGEILTDLETGETVPINQCIQARITNGLRLNRDQDYWLWNWVFENRCDENLRVVRNSRSSTGDSWLGSVGRVKAGGRQRDYARWSIEDAQKEGLPSQPPNPLVVWCVYQGTNIERCYGENGYPPSNRGRGSMANWNELG